LDDDFSRHAGIRGPGVPFARAQDAIHPEESRSEHRNTGPNVSGHF